ncbi:MAG: 2Fe-2S iron-sulfur cluster binding domain-containing protein [Cellvibrionales bacterium]|nr:2Fe-2S iron-sulfur cluster binding domain-containing protein [Cellvibrionales bacterium]
MAQITFITPSGEEVTVTAQSGSVMQAAVTNMVEGIDGDCGGVCSCATCHVHVDPAWLDKVGAAGDIEKEMLELEDGSSDHSRLSCQIEVSDELDGLVLRVVKN